MIRDEFDGTIQRTSVPNTPDTFIRMNLLEWENDRRVAEHTARALAMAKTLVDAYARTGVMTIRLPDGRELADRPHRTEDATTDAYNMLGMARHLAYRATDERPPLSVGIPPSD